MAKNLVPQAVQPALAVVDGTPMVNSVEVARHFGKRHDNVIQAIQTLMGQLPPDHLLNFQEMIRVFPAGKGATNTGLTYNLTRDGFTLLAMGFTGEKALAFKLAYIDAFNRMEAELSRLYVEPLTGDREFRKGLKFSDRMKLQEQGLKIARALDKSGGPAERFTLYWQLRQVNDTLGIPTPSAEAVGLTVALLGQEGGAA